MQIITTHADNAISNKTTFQKSILGAILNDNYFYTEIDAGLVVLASTDPNAPQYNLAGRLLGVSAGGSLTGIVERIEFLANSAAVTPSVVHLLDGEQLLADLDFSARADSGLLTCRAVRVTTRCAVAQAMIFSREVGMTARTSFLAVTARIGFPAVLATTF